MKQQQFFNPLDRYVFDFKLCTTKNGFAQVDTGQDAHYFGIWANPFEKRVVTYCEGDVTIEDAETIAEFVSIFENIKRFYDESGYGYRGIDPGFNDDLKAEFIKMGMTRFFYPDEQEAA